ncbi:hypothetical protein [Geomicrobium sp. JCM 19055]|uniref:hypothetical protein n=1 Tax=Geomicrobium sp. JCM 19055 TaxID=1460649 RepID=UPI00045ED9EC|nr:hypothetical protein [Geomicrobium sp. JCM 19055]GAK01780.1 hypothetical protein JCM19055_4987 [Geomicrobium sp. JCM 19055]
MKRLLCFLLVMVVTAILYQYRHVFINKLLMNEARRRFIISTMMNIKPIRRRMLARYSPFQ